jgi:hypothetical protein
MGPYNLSENIFETILLQRIGCIYPILAYNMS